MLDDELNAAIDDAARRTTEGSPAAGFRRRVIARIESGDAPRRSWRAAFVLPPIAAAAAIAIAVFVTRGVPDHGAEPFDSAQGRQAPPLRETPAMTAGAREAPTMIAGVGAELAPPRNARERGVRQGAGADRNTLDPAPPLDSIAVAPLVVESLSPDPIHIERLGTIAPMTIAPLEITDEPKER